MVSVKTSCRPAGPLEGGGQERPQPRRAAELTARISCKHYTTETNPHPHWRRLQNQDFVYYQCTITVCVTVCARCVFLTTQLKATAFYNHVALWIICVLVAGSLTQLSQFRCHRCPSDAHVKAAVVYTARDRYQQLRRTASTQALCADARAPSGKATNHHVGVMTAFTIPGQTERWGAGVSVKRG
jgi:hypothetical protein